MDMRILRSHQFLRICAVLALTVAYLSQTTPHGHFAAHHLESHSAPTTHSHHDHDDPHDHHSHDHHTHDSADDPGDHWPAEPDHHHHAVSPHLDVHSLRHVRIETSPDQLGAVIPATVSAMTAPFLANEKLAVIVAAPIPDEPWLPYTPSRAPPA
jgi:hypothetical protein